MIKSHEFIVRIDGNPYELVTGFRFSRSMDVMGGAFTLDLIDPPKKIISAFRPGVKTQIEIDGKILAKAIFDSVSINDQNGHEYSYAARDPSADLVDCSAVFSDGKFTKKKITLDALITDLLKPFNMTFKLAVNDVGKPFDEISITPGETVAEVIRRACKYRSVFPLSDGVGGLIITKAGKTKSSGALVVGENGNVQSRRGMISHAQRYSEIKVMGGSNGGDSWGAASPESLAENIGRAKDPDVKRHRPLIIQSESEGTNAEYNERAEWEVRHRRFSGTDIAYTVGGWEASEGQFWVMNTLVPVDDPELFVNRDMLIKGVELYRNVDGTHTDITVAPAEAYDLPASREPASDDAIWGGGA